MTLTSKQYYDRDLSWLRFNHRVLQEVADKRNPLYERIKFLAIFASNLDEFFEVRISAIRQIQQLDKDLRKKLITKPNKLLKRIKKELTKLQEELDTIMEEDITIELEKEGIQFMGYTDYLPEHQQFAQEYFAKNIAQYLTMKVRENQDTKNLDVENEQLYLVALLSGSELIWLKIPNEVPRFLVLNNQKEGYFITSIDDILKHVFSQYYETEFYSLKVSRDAELYIDNEYSGNLLEKIQDSLQNRDTGQITRALIDKEMPEDLVNTLMQFLDISEVDIILSGSHHNLKHLFDLPNPTSNKLTFEDLPPKRQKALADFECMFNAIDKQDRLLYFPYESFEDIIRFMEQAAMDEDVRKIKITLYRVSENSAIAKALLCAVKKGKEVSVFIETKARFDEANNIKWGKILEENGANVIYSYPGIKVHSKIFYIERMENNEEKAYAYVGTGNFNEKTARIYTDFGLLTANSAITDEVLQVFQVLERKLIITKTKNILVSPFSTRSRFEKMIEKEIKNAKDGKEAYIILKLNSLQDPKMINLLYKASNAGVKVRLVIRGICCLVPGIKNQSENIYVTSIIDRFLEHARIYIFANGGKEKMYIGSADWMTRNLDNRIEVITPILDKGVFEKVRKALQLQLDDTIKARLIDAEQKNNYVSTPSEGKSAQYLSYQML